MTVTLSMALPRKYSGFNLSHAVPVPTQVSARLVGIVGLEPTRPLGHQILSLARLPIPPYPHMAVFFLEAPRNLDLKRISRACTPSPAASPNNSHLRLVVVTIIHPCTLSAPHKAVNSIRLVSNRLVFLALPANFPFSS